MFDEPFFTNSFDPSYLILIVDSPLIRLWPIQVIDIGKTFTAYEQHQGDEIDKLSLCTELAEP